MSIKFEVKMTEKVMYDFMLYHNYTHPSGMISALVGIAMLVAAGYRAANGQTDGIMLYIGLGLIMLLMTPLSLKNVAKSQVKRTKMFQEPLQYEVSETGVTVAQNGEKATNEWNNFMKVVSTNKSLILYMTRVRAIILPKESMGNDYMAVVEMISKHVQPQKVKIRHVR